MTENKIPVQPSLEEQLESLKQQLDWQKAEHKNWERETKKEAFKMALQNKPQPNYGGIGAPNNSYSTDQLIKDANKIYEELIK